MRRILLAGILAAAVQRPADAAPRLAVPARGRLYHGVYPGGKTGYEDDIAPQDLSAYEAAVGRRPAWVYFSNNWFQSREFPATTARWIQARGMIPFVRLMMRSSPVKNRREKVFTLKKIAAGDFDKDLGRWMEGARAFGGPLLVEWGTEANGSWFSWNARWNGKSKGPHLFAECFRRIVKISRAKGADNIAWVFHVDAHDSPATDWNRLESYYPGDDFVDWIAVSAYGPQTYEEADEEPLGRMLDDVYPRLAGLSPSKPIILAEFGCDSKSPRVDQADWARKALAGLFSDRWPRLKGFSWWNERWENDDSPAHDTDMRVQDNPALAAAFKEALAAAKDKILERPEIRLRP